MLDIELQMIMTDYSDAFLERIGQELDTPAHSKRAVNFSLPFFAVAFIFRAA